MQGTSFGLKKAFKYIILPLIIFAVLIAVDQVTKYYFKGLENKNRISTNEIQVIKNFFYFTYTENSGAAYSLFSNKSWGQTFLKILTCVALVIFVFLYIYAYKHKYKLMIYSVVFITGGTVGNFIDRLARGSVIDFMCAEFWGKRWFGVFNFADLFLTAGVIMILVHFLFLDDNALFKKKDGKTDTENSNTENK